MSSKTVTPDYVKETIKAARPEKLTLPVPPRVDHADHIVKTALAGHTKLAADHVLHPEMCGHLMEVVGSVVRRVNAVFASHRKAVESGCPDALKRVIVERFRLYDALLELVWNLVGIESVRVGFEWTEVANAIDSLVNALKDWEAQERFLFGGDAPVLKAVIDEQLRSMKIVNKGNSMLAWMAEEAEKKLDPKNLVETYVKALGDLITNNIYYRASLEGLCKFGNDYALGLRWLRHLGYVQVSTNPALAAKAYSDDPELWEAFKEYAKEVLMKEHPEWFKDPEKYQDEIAMEATRFGLMDNFLVFRPPFFWSDYHDGLVSYQLNPLIADKADESVEAAREFAARLEEDLRVYDAWLLWGYSPSIERGRPNLVVKVACAYPAALEIARRLNELGIGQNITVSYTVSQEVLAAYAAMRGMAKAIKMGIKPVQTYDTNMGGRLEDHLRESIVADLILKGLEGLDEAKREEILDNLAKGFGLSDEEVKALKEKPLRERVEYLTSKKVMGRNIVRDPLIDALTATGKYGGRDEVKKMLETLAEDLALSGTYVAQRVYEILFSPWNRVKWIDHLVKEFGISVEDAEMILDRIDLLPASKRKPIDTLYTFASRNMTNTEFPNHQLNVLKESMKEGFNLSDYAESIMQELPKENLERLMKYEDFVKAFEASPKLNELLRKVGITKNYGNRGIDPEEWPNYGPCVKTMKGFKAAYIEFREKVIKTIKELAGKA